ncbi:MAG TPA: hypothetical protein VHX61_03170 [Rhizomicrobium sp.]|jgi:hypothetical protein|nr:hypothetical protein [Rhizomicrobium sp.]
MSVAGKAQIGRRRLLEGLVAAAGIAVTAAAAFEAPRFFAPRYAPSAFDDLLAKLPDRQSAIRIGAAFLAGGKSFDANGTATALRRRLAATSLATAMNNDLRESRMVEAHGWVLPETLGDLCALAAKAG